MRVFSFLLLMAALFLSGCATPVPHESAVALKSHIATAKAKVQAARSAPAPRREELLVETEKSLDSAACSLAELEKALSKSEKKADEMAKSTEFWRKRYFETHSKLNSWRFAFSAGIAVLGAIGLAAFAVSRIRPFSIF